METTELAIVDSYLTTCINLQLAVAKGKMDLPTLYNNFKQHSVTVGFDLEGFNYANFLNFIDAHRDQFDMCEGEIGTQVNLIALKGV